MEAGESVAEDKKKVVIVGGGIAGLASAFYLQKNDSRRSSPHRNSAD